MLRNGQLVDVVKAADSTPDEITTLMIGQALKALDRPAPAQTEGRRRSSRCGTCTGATAKGVSFDVAPGEILGLYGLVGSGRSSVARTITGQKRAAERHDHRAW